MRAETKTQEEIFSKVVRAGRRTYFFDVRETRAGDYYLTITESKKFVHDDGSFNFKKHKIYLYKEDFNDFKATLDECIAYILDEKGEVVISERHDPNFYDTISEEQENSSENNTDDGVSDYTDVDFDKL